MGSRTWIKIYTDKWLNGTIREESLEVRAVWVDLLVLAGSGKYGDSGEIKITDTVGLLDQQLADLLQISTRKWKIISKRLQETDRICISQKNVIAITNWSKYQSEYERQRDQRIRDGVIKSAGKSATESAEQSAARDRDVRCEIRDRDVRCEIPPLTPPTVSLFDPLIEKALNDYQDAIVLPGTLLSAEMKAELLQACQTFSPESVSDAIKQAVAQQQRTWRYIRGILNNRQGDGNTAKFAETQ